MSLSSSSTPTLPSTSLFRVSKPKSRYLLIVNKGPGAVTIPREGSEWDLLEIYFMKSDIESVSKNPGSTDAEHVVFETDRQMRKFAIIKAAFLADDFWKSYDVIMMADDDLMPVGCTLSDIFRLFESTKCRIGQPALTTDSFFTHMITVQNKSFVWRRTNFAEVMCPIFSKSAVEDYLKIFDATVSGFGLDDYWSYFEWLNGTGCAILDDTPMKHSRPVRGGIAYQGITPEDECIGFMRQQSIPRFILSCYGGQMKEGVAEHSGMAVWISGYERRFMHDPRYINYVIDESRIRASLPPAFEYKGLDPQVRDRIENLRHIAGVGLFMTASSAGLLAPLTPMDEVQNQIRVHWASTSWQKTQGLRNLVSRLSGRPIQATPPTFTNIVTAQRYLDSLRRSPFWRMTGPARRLVERYRRS